ncbi:MAG: hypothetical protein IPM27_12095 [Nitrosomonadales bacterium]|nr:hypothetical protein [Nitrosomonadales bacterium]
MAVSDGLIVWVDGVRRSSALVLHQGPALRENFFGHHQFRCARLPPGRAVPPLDVRGDFHGDSFDDLGEWRGSLLHNSTIPT